jgi:hypothetical protein
MTMRRHIALALICAPLLAACGQAVPSMPSYQTDVQPIVLARCVRCHGGGNCLQAENGASPPPNGFFQNYFDDPPGCSTADGGLQPPDPNDPCPRLLTSCRFGFHFYALQVGGTIPTRDVHRRIHEQDSARMPPPPATSLTDRQFEVLDRWFENPIQ